MSVKANGRYMTWWNAKRINSKVKYSELSELFGLNKSQAGQQGFKRCLRDGVKNVYKGGLICAS